MNSEINIIKNLEQKLLNAMRNADTDTLSILIHDSLLFNVPGGQTFTKVQDLESYKSGQMNVTEISAKDQAITLIGDNVIVVTTITMEGHYFDHVIDGDYRFLRVWKKINDSWQVIAGSSTPML